MQHLKKTYLQLETTFGIIPSAKSTRLTDSSGTVSGNACSLTGTAGSAANICIVDHFTNLAPQVKMFARPCQLSISGFRHS